MDLRVDNHFLTVLVFSPLIGVAFILFINGRREDLIRNVAFITSLGNLALSLAMLRFFRLDTPLMQFEVAVPWIRQFGISYHMGVDGVSLLLVFLTSLLTAIGILSSWRYITKRVKEYMIMMLLLETGMLGVFVSLDLFLFYLFWEAMLVPMYFLIGAWGGERRIYAAIKFFLYTMTGSVLMLVGIVVMYFIHLDQFGRASFDLYDFHRLSIPYRTEMWLFAAFAVAFAIKVPLFPFHTWLPDAHVEAPTAGSVILAGVLLKMGTYGFLRFAIPLFPTAAHAFAPLVCTLAVVSIIYGALVAMVQPDVKKLVAYSSVSHLGFVMLGLFAFNLQGIEGGIIQMINHGLSTGALFLIVGMLYERRHTRLIADFGGLAKPMPAFFVCFLIVTLSSIGLPGLNGFVGEFLILLGSFRANLYYTIPAAAGVILAAVYMLWMFQRVMYGRADRPENRALKDLSVREYAVLIPIIVLIFWIGVYSKPFLRTMDFTVRHLIIEVERKRGGPPPAMEAPAPVELAPSGGE
ncbi:MAG: NADH-quinone oxidoreductase subunit M [bacterium]